MINTSAEFKEAMKENNTCISKAEILLKDGTKLSIGSNVIQGGIKIDDSVCSTGKFEIGNAISNKLCIYLNNMRDDFSEYDFTEATVTVWIGKVLSKTTEWIKKGVFIAQDPTTTPGIITLECLDYMSKFNNAYDGKLIFPATLQQIIQYCCSRCGVIFSSDGFPNSGYQITKNPFGSSENFTYRVIVQYCAMLAGCFARCNTDGILELKWYDAQVFETGNYAEVKSFNSLSVSTEDVVITGIRVTASDLENEDKTEKGETYLAGAEGYVLSISGNPLVEYGQAKTVASLLAERIVGMRFRPMTASCLGNPAWEAGDAVLLTNRKGKTYKSFLTNLTYYTGNYESISCDAEPAARHSADHYKEIEQIIANIKRDTRFQLSQYGKYLDQMNGLAINAMGYYETVEIQDDGSRITYMHDKPLMSESMVIYKKSIDGYFWSKDGGKTWTSGIDKNGNAVMNVIAAIGLHAEWITSGKLQVSDDKGNIIFLVDMDTKQVIISGDSVRIGGKTATAALNDVLVESKDYADGKLADYANIVTSSITNLQAQIDGQIETFYYDYEPSLQNIPASQWTTTEERQKHEGDLFYWKSKGYAYRFFKDGATWKWQLVQDTDITQAMAAAEKAKDTADGKRRVFVVTPQPPYDIGDLWANGTDILTATVARDSGSTYVSSDWKKLNKYTDDSFAEQVQENLDNLQIGGTQILRGTNTVTELTSTGVWSNGTWRRASTDSDSTGNTRASIKVTDAPNPNIKVGWEITRNAGSIDIAQDSVPVTQGQTYTMSCYAKGTGLLRLRYGKSPRPTKTYTLSNLTKWTKYSFTFTIGAQSDGSTAGITNIYFGNGGNGTLEICGMLLETGNRATDWTPAPEDTETYADNLAADLQTQIDGKIQTYNQTTDPSTAWTTTALKTQHTGDLWYNASTKETKRWSGTAWVKLENKEAEEAGALAQKKAQVFTGTPQPPYDIGDLWFNSATSDIMTCVTARTTGSYTASDWEKRNKYTDDTVANQALAEAQNARNLNIILDNEYQGIPADYQGNIETFPAVQTYVQAFYGHADVSVNCSYSVAKSAGVTGTWNGATRTYTVTALTTDTGWVDITASYLSLFTTTKRFNIAKIKGGMPGEQGADGRGIKSTATTYQASTSGVDVPSGTWVSSPPTVAANQYLWTRTIITYTDNTTSTSYSIGKMGANGTNGKDGADGVGISSVSEHYQVSTSNSTAPTTWQTTVPTMTATNKYLWNYETITYTNGTTADTAKRVIGVYGDKGATGAAGKTGKGIKSVTNYYLATASASGVTTSTSGWTITVQSVSASKKYLWNYETITYTDNTTSSTAPCIIGAYGDKGANGTNGTDGKDGVGISSTAITYQASSSGTSIPTGTWSSSVPSTSAGQYLWTRTVITYTDGSTASSYSVGRNGNNGAPGRTYFIEPSTLVLKKGQDNVISPGTVDFKAFYRDGNSASRTAYSGRFKIEETVDGTTWKTIYTSSANESSVKHSTYDYLTDAAGNAIITASGHGIVAAVRDIHMIRCTLYAAGGTTNALDIQSVTVVKDVKALTQEEVFNILTNNGAVKGIWMENGQLYISFTIAKGGEITLGGVNNGNGKLVILDSKGRQVGYIDNTGAHFNKGEFLGELKSGNDSTYIMVSDGNLSFYSYGKLVSQYGKGSNSSNVLYEKVYGSKSCNILRGATWFTTNEDNSYNSVRYDNGIRVGGGGKMRRDSLGKDVSADILCICTPPGNTYKELAGILFGDSTTAPRIYRSYSDRIEIAPGQSSGSGSLFCHGGFGCAGTKSRDVKTKDYSNRLLYCYEMPSPMFGDAGEAVTDESGTCYIYLDDIFAKTINSCMEYQVFLQKEGQGDLWVDLKESAYFIAKGTPGLKFSWEIKAKQRDYEYERLESTEVTRNDVEIIDYETQGQGLFEEYLLEKETAYEESN